MPRLRLRCDRRCLRELAAQALLLAAVAGVLAWLAGNTGAKLAQQGIASGFGFLGKEAAFAISEHPIAYSPADSYARALTVGVLNTLKVALPALLFATVLGTLAGIAQLGRNWLAARLARGYVEAVRNVPLLLQLFFWYGLLTELLPLPRQAWSPLPGVFLSRRGLMLPAPDGGGWGTLLAAAALGLVAALGLLRATRGRARPGIGALAALLLLAPPLVAGFATAGTRGWSVPALQGFNYVGGTTLSPEFAALLLGLTLYAGSYIAEIVRAGILAVPRGQVEAGLALGLSRAQVLRLIVLPQALRAIVPPLASQYLSLVKNSSLAVAIGYPDLVSISNTAINQTGQAVEGIALIMAAYLTVSLAVAALMNLYNRRVALRGATR